MALWGFINVFRWARHWCVSCPRSNHFTSSHHLSLRLFLILLHHIRRDLLRGLYPSRFYDKNFACISLILHACRRLILSPWQHAAMNTDCGASQCAYFPTSHYHWRCERASVAAHLHSFLSPIYASRYIYDIIYLSTLFNEEFYSKTKYLSWKVCYKFQRFVFQSLGSVVTAAMPESKAINSHLSH
jgi:hypothetical protein